MPILNLKGHPVAAKVAPAIVLVSILTGARPTAAQEAWKPDLMICGANSADVWHQANDTACIAPYTPLDRFNFPNDFSERTVTDAATGAVTRELLVADTWHDPGGRVLRFRLDGTLIGAVPGSFNRPYGA